jgi:hypothetical protein
MGEMALRCPVCVDGDRHPAGTADLVKELVTLSHDLVLDHLPRDRWP